jgi:hypothetical protein
MIVQQKYCRKKANFAADTTVLQASPQIFFFISKPKKAALEQQPTRADRRVRLEAAEG